MSTNTKKRAIIIAQTNKKRLKNDYKQKYFFKRDDLKGSGIAGMRPLVQETDDAKSESLSPHVWETKTEADDYKQTIVLMPLRL